MLKIRLQRIGKKNKAYFRVVVTEHTTAPKGRYLELLGSYDPHKKELIVKEDRVKHWLANGAQLSATMNNLLIDKNIIQGQKVTSWKPKKKKKEEETDQKAKPEEKPSEEKTTEDVETKEEPTKDQEIKETPKEEAETPEQKSSQDVEESEKPSEEQKETEESNGEKN